jgi:hypothetical protein
LIAFRALKRARVKARAIRRDAREHRANAAASADRTLYGCRELFHHAAHHTELEQASQSGCLPMERFVLNDLNSACSLERFFKSRVSKTSWIF